jgi:hypothetical protein
MLLVCNIDGVKSNRDEQQDVVKENVLDSLSHTLYNKQLNLNSTRKHFHPACSVLLKHLECVFTSINHYDSM